MTLIGKLIHDPPHRTVWRKDAVPGGDELWSGQAFPLIGKKGADAGKEGVVIHFTGLVGDFQEIELFPGLRGEASRAEDAAVEGGKVQAQKDITDVEEEVHKSGGASDCWWSGSSRSR